MVMPMIAGLRSEQWRSLSVGERLQALQDIETALAQQENREPCEVRFVPDSAYENPDDQISIRGAHQGKTILLNEALVNPDVEHRVEYADNGTVVNPDEPYMAVETLLHEDRHDHQAYVADQRPGLAESPQQLEDFQKNAGPGYIPPEGNSLKYECQPTETDARQAGRQGTDELYADDPGYEAHRDHMVAEEQYTAQLATLRLGSNYEEIVRQDVYRQYEGALSQSAGNFSQDIPETEATQVGPSEKASPDLAEGTGGQEQITGPSAHEADEVGQEEASEGNGAATARANIQTANGEGAQATAEAGAPSAAQASAEAAGEAAGQVAAQSASEVANEEAAPIEGESDVQATGETANEPTEGYDYYSGYGYGY